MNFALLTETTDILKPPARHKQPETKYTEKAKTIRPTIDWVQYGDRIPP